MLAMPCLETTSCTHQGPCVGGDIVSWVIRTWEGVLATPELCLYSGGR